MAASLPGEERKGMQMGLDARKGSQASPGWQLALLCPQRPWSLGSMSSLWEEDQDDLSSLFQSARVIGEPTSTWLLVGLPGREEGGAQLQVKGILLPVCPGPPDHAGRSHSQKGGECPRAQANGPSVLTREGKGEREHARMHTPRGGVAW